MKTRAIILAGGEGSRLGVLTAKRTKPAVPFAGKYRIIDFTLSNCINSGISDVMILAQYRPHSLIEHIGSGSPWDLNRDFTGGIRIYTPYKSRRLTNWYLGTADAVQQNFSFIKRANPDLLLILSGDHIYSMNYDVLIAFHLDHQADLTMATITVPISEAPRFGIIGVGDNYRVTSFVEKPKNPPSNVANMGVYLFNFKTLDRALLSDYQHPDSAHDFGKDIIPNLVSQGARIFAYPYTGYWVDVGTVSSYWDAHMDLIASPPSLDLDDRSWVIHTRTEERPPVRIEKGSEINNSMISDGCVISANAILEQSILSPGVRIMQGAIVRNSVVLTDSIIKSGAVVENAILDKKVQVGEDSRIGEFTKDKSALISMVGKNSHIPRNMTIYPGVEIDTDLLPTDFQSNVVRFGETIKKIRSLDF